MDNLQVSIEYITPEKAQSLLDMTPTYQRKLDPKRGREFAKLIEQGEWKVSGQGITVSDKGYLLDGQHRLMGVTLAGKAVHVVVLRGVPEDTFYVIDRGKMRRLDQFLEGKNRTAKAALLRVLINLEYKEGRVRRSDLYEEEVSAVTQAEFLDRHPYVAVYVDTYGKVAGKGAIASDGITKNGLLLGGYYSGDPAAWYADVQRIIDKHGLPDGNPVKSLMSVKPPKSGPNVENAFRGLVAAEFYRRGRSVSTDSVRTRQYVELT